MGHLSTTTCPRIPLALLARQWGCWETKLMDQSASWAPLTPSSPAPHSGVFLGFGRLGDSGNSHLKESQFELSPWVGKMPWRRKWQPTPVFLPGKSHGQNSSWGHKELDTSEQLIHYHTEISVKRRVSCLSCLALSLVYHRTKDLQGTKSRKSFADKFFFLRKCLEIGIYYVQ